MRQYEHLGFRTPYQVLIDAQLIIDSAKCKLHLGKLLSDALGGAEIKPMITQCCIRHLYNRSTTTDSEKAEKDGWIEVAKAAERRRCGHHELEEPLSTLECLQSVVDPKGSGHNRHRYVVASQDKEVRMRMREIVGVPLVYLKRSVMILEPMAGATEQARHREEREKIRAGLKGRRGQQQVGKKRMREDEGQDDIGDESVDEQEASVPKRKKVKGPKGPNPMSVKKSKKGNEQKSNARQAEDERAVMRKASKADPQANEKALDATVAAEATTAASDVADGQRKRKRKRKHAEQTDGVPTMAVTEA
jgi:U3 small nucleolar RNA-associated protein 23